MAAKRQADSNTNNVHVYEGAVKMSAYQPIDIKPLYGRKWVTNGVNNVNLKLTKMLTTIARQTAVL
jgi:hypothetical protein